MPVGVAQVLSDPNQPMRRTFAVSDVDIVRGGVETGSHGKVVEHLV